MGNFSEIANIVCSLWPKFIKLASCLGGATTWIPIGNPFSVNPQGMHKVGQEVIVIAKVMENQSILAGELKGVG